MEWELNIMDLWYNMLHDILESLFLSLVSREDYKSILLEIVKKVKHKFCTDRKKRERKTFRTYFITKLSEALAYQQEDL